MYQLDKLLALVFKCVAEWKMSRVQESGDWNVTVPVNFCVSSVIISITSMWFSCRFTNFASFPGTSSYAFASRFCRAAISVFIFVGCANGGEVNTLAF